MVVYPIILSSGASSRMGTPKALLDFAGLTTLQRAVKACADAGLARPLVVIRSDLQALVDHARDLAITTVINPRPERGQTSSLREGLRFLPTDADGFLIYPVDYPLITGADIRALMARFSSTDSLVVAPSFQHRRGHPVLVAAAVAAELLALPDDGSARTVMTVHRDHTSFVQMVDDRSLVDMDTPDDYQMCLDRSQAV